MPSAEPTTQLSPERRAPRERAFLTARISYGNGALSTPCTVMQISSTGAKIGIGAATSLPEIFQIVIAQKAIDCRAKLVWRRGDVAGVAFQRDAPPAELPAGDAAKLRLKALQTENEKLKAHIGKLTAQIARLTNE